MPSIQGPAQPTQAVATHCGHMVFCYQNIMVVDVAERDPWTGYSHSNRGSPLGQKDWSCFEAVSAASHPIAAPRHCWCHSQAVALFDPAHRRYIVSRLLHLQQMQNVTSPSTPQGYTVVQSHSQYIPRAPIHKVQVVVIPDFRGIQDAVWQGRNVTAGLPAGARRGLLAIEYF